jgi:23S rRNA (pseudouridine1915-N3)-methyltransferase
MRNIRLIWIGKSQESFVQDGIKVYLKKISHYTKVDFEEIKPVKYNSGTTEQWRRQETENLIKRLDSSELNIFLDESGSIVLSKPYAPPMKKLTLRHPSGICFSNHRAKLFEVSLFPLSSKKMFNSVESRRFSNFSVSCLRH